MTGPDDTAAPVAAPPPAAPRNRRRLAIIGAAVAAAAVLAGVLAYVFTSGSSSPAAKLSHGPTTLPTPSDLPPTPSDTGGGSTPHKASSTPPAVSALCAYAQKPLQTATTYVSAAESGITDLAQSCVYHRAVARSVTASLKNKVFAPQTTDLDATTVQFKTIDGTGAIVVSVAKEPDGKFYVVGVRTG